MTLIFGSGWICLFSIYIVNSFSIRALCSATDMSVHVSSTTNTTAIITIRGPPLDSIEPLDPIDVCEFCLTD